MAGVNQVAQLRIKLATLATVKSPKPTQPTPTTEPTPKPRRGEKRDRSPDDDLEALDESPDTSSTPVEDKRVLLHLSRQRREQASRLLAPSGTSEPSKPSAETLTMRNDAEAPVTMADHLMQSQVMLPCR